MGVLYDICTELTHQMESRATSPMDVVRAKGEVSVKCGVMVGLVGPNDADDPVAIANLRQAALELGYTLST